MGTEGGGRFSATGEMVSAGGENYRLLGQGRFTDGRGLLFTFRALAQLNDPAFLHPASALPASLSFTAHGAVTPTGTAPNGARSFRLVGNGNSLGAPKLPFSFEAQAEEELAHAVAAQADLVRASSSNVCSQTEDYRDVVSASSQTEPSPTSNDACVQTDELPELTDPTLPSQSHSSSAVLVKRTSQHSYFLDPVGPPNDFVSPPLSGSGSASSWTTASTTQQSNSAGSSLSSVSSAQSSEVDFGDPVFQTLSTEVFISDPSAARHQSPNVSSPRRPSLGASPLRDLRPRPNKPLLTSTPRRPPLPADRIPVRHINMDIDGSTYNLGQMVTAESENESGLGVSAGDDEVFLRDAAGSRNATMEQTQVQESLLPSPSGSSGSSQLESEAGDENTESTGVDEEEEEPVRVREKRVRFRASETPSTSFTCVSATDLRSALEEESEEEEAVFPWAEVRAGLATRTEMEVSESAGAMMGGVLEWLCLDLLEGAGNAARARGDLTLRSQDLARVAATDPPYSALLKDVIFSPSP